MSLDIMMLTGTSSEDEFVEVYPSLLLDQKRNGPGGACILILYELATLNATITYATT
jgi:hypothetical protein